MWCPFAPAAARAPAASAATAPWSAVATVSRAGRACVPRAPLARAAPPSPLPPSSPRGAASSSLRPLRSCLANTTWGCASRRVACRAFSGDRAEGARSDGGGGSGAGGNYRRPISERERSVLVNEEVVYFIFQLDLDTQLQRCLNYEAYEAAQDVRKKRQRVDEAVATMRDRKARNTAAGVGGGPAGGAAGEAGGYGPGAAAALSAADYAAECVRLRSEMQRAVETEDYATAARFRDLLKALEVEARRAAALAAEWDTTVGSNSGPLFKLGQRVLHRDLRYRGVVVGWDGVCAESEEWVGQAKVDATRRGTRQVFYHLLVDARDWEYDPHLPPVAYVAEELLSSPELEAEGGKSWAETYGTDPLQHPYLYILFLGMDGRGDYVPCRQLRDKYNVQRRDVYRPGEDGSASPPPPPPPPAGGGGPPAAAA